MLVWQLFCFATILQSDVYTHIYEKKNLTQYKMWLELVLMSDEFYLLLFPRWIETQIKTKSTHAFVYPKPFCKFWH